MKKRTRHQKQCVKCCEENENLLLDSETTLVNYFSNLVVTCECGPGTMYCVHSHLRSCIIVQCKVNVKDFTTLRLRITRATQDHTVSKLDAPLSSVIKLGLTALLNEDDDKDMLLKVGIAIVCFGVISRLEMPQTQIKDVTINDLVSTERPRATKRRNKGLRFKISDWLVSTFTKYIGKFEIGLTNNFRMTKNHHRKGMSRTENMGEGQISKSASVLAQRLEKDILKKKLQQNRSRDQLLRRL